MPRKVLIVDDEPGIRQALGQLLEFEGYDVHSADNATDGITYRYKENVPVLSNLTGTKRGTPPNQSLFLSREIPPQGDGDQVEALVLSASALLQLTSDGPDATTQQLGATATDLPVYLHQADSPAIIAPASARRGRA